VPHALGGGDRIAGWLAESVSGTTALHASPAHEGAAAAHGAAESAHASAAGGGHADAMTEILLMALSTLVALAGAGTAYIAYVARPGLPAAVAARAGALYRLLSRRWWVDEIYGALFVRPLFALSERLWRYFDAGVIDRIVNGVGRTAEAGSYILRLSQSGHVQTYGLLMLIALAALTVKLL
jgi:NADH-quinone oxidoreductase subunit L